MVQGLNNIILAKKHREEKKINGGKYILLPLHPLIQTASFTQDQDVKTIKQFGGFSYLVHPHKIFPA